MSDLRRSGGMSEIVQAKLNSTGETCALKFSRRGDSDSQAVASFSREANALSDISHRNIVRLLGIGTDGAKRFLALEWLEETLSDYILSIGPMEWPSFYENVGRPILEGLEHAHGRGYAHRDLKPLNIMLSRMREPKLTDFGISRHTEDQRNGYTFAGMGSAPWTPAELDDGVFSERRDLYSWAAICVACLTGRLDYKSVAELRAKVKELGLLAPQRLLEQCMSDSPLDRPASASLLIWNLDDYHRARLADTDRARLVGIEMSGQVHERLLDLLPHEADADARVRRLQQDFADPCEVSLLNEGDLEFAGQTLVVRAKRGSTDSPWLIVNDIRAASLVVAAAATARLTLEFVERRPGVPVNPELRANISFIESFLRSTEVRAKEEQRRRDEERYLNMLQDTVTARMRALRDMPALEYVDGRWDGGEFVVNVVGAHSLKLGEKRVVRTAKAVLVLQVTRVQYDQAHFLLIGQRRQIPSEGVLRVDTGAQRRALERQEEAVKALRSDTAVMPNLRQLLLRPGTADAPEPGGRPSPDGLSEDKVKVLDAALGMRQIMVVEGPPGTGKTTLITAIVKQFLREHPGSRVLLAAQTHIAIDHVVSKLLKDESLADRIVRVARADEEKVADDVRPALLDRCLARWCQNAAEQSRKFLAQRGLEVGLKALDVELSIRLEMLLAACKRQQVVVSSLEDAGQRLDAAETRAVIAPEADVSGLETATVETLTMAELDLERDQLGEHIARLREELRALGPDGQLLAEVPENEQASWLEMLEQRGEAWPGFRKQLELQVAWLDVLGQLRQLEEVVLRGASVVAGTCVGLGSSEAFSKTRFDLCIIDEASKATPTEALVPIVRSEQCLIVGDPKQLPPFDGDAVEVDGYGADEAKETLLDYLIPRLTPACVERLTHQHRMCAGIGGLISRCFYFGTLENKRPDSERPEWLRKKFSKPVVWIDTPNSPQQRRIHTYTNAGEQDVVLAQLKTIQYCASRAQQKASVAVIAGYAAQADALNSRIQRDSFASLSIEVATVDSFQGKEADICIFSVTLSNSADFLGFLRSMKRLNVALSRPKDLLIIVGNQTFCYQATGENPFVKVIDYIEANPASCETRRDSN